MRRYSQWTQMGLFALLAACNGGGGGGTEAQSQGSDSADATESGSETANATQGGATESGDPTDGGGTDSASGGQTTGDSTGDSDATTGDDTTSTTANTSDSGTTTEGVDTTGNTGETTGDDTEGGPCPLAMMHLACDHESDDPLHAIGVNCTSLGGPYQNNTTAVSAAKIVFEAAPETLGKRAWQVAKAYGDFVDPQTQQPFWGAREGEKVLLISSGLLPPPDDTGAVIVDDGDLYNDVALGPPWDSPSMPPPMNPQNGSPDPNAFTNCDGVGDCSNTLWKQWNDGFGDAQDKMWFGFELVAPAIADGAISDANGYSFDFAFFSAEFPEFVGTEYNDIFVVWQASEDYTGNVTFVNKQPLTVTALWPIDFQGQCKFGDPNCQGADPHLSGTGHRTDGGATSWYIATGGVNPGETFSLTFGIFDMSDSIYDTTAILDNWMWDCEGCVPNEIDSCGVAPT